MKDVFQYCVDALRVLANLLGVTYEEINVWLFVIIHPIVTLCLFSLYRKYKKMNKVKELELNKIHNSESLKEVLRVLDKDSDPNEFSKLFTLKEFKEEMERRGYKRIKDFTYNPQKDKDFLESLEKN